MAIAIDEELKKKRGSEEHTLILVITGFGHQIGINTLLQEQHGFAKVLLTEIDQAIVE